MKKIICYSTIMFSVLSITQTSSVFANETISEGKVLASEITSEENNYPLFEEVTSISETTSFEDEKTPELKKKKDEVMSTKDKTNINESIPIFENMHEDKSVDHHDKHEYISRDHEQSTMLNNKKVTSVQNKTKQNMLPLSGIQSSNATIYGLILFVSVWIINKSFKKITNEEK